MEQAAEEEESSSEKPSENVEVISEKPKDCEVTETAEAKKGTLLMPEKYLLQAVG